MLEFFRKYQRFFFLIVTSVIILSFTFFGTFSTFINDVEVSDRSIGKGIDGSDLKLFELQRLSRFLATDAYDVPSPGSLPNFLNDGVIRKDFLSLGLAELLVQEYFEYLKEELETRRLHTGRFRFYAHPEAPWIGVESVWGQFYPAINQEIAALRAEEETTPSLFHHLSELYLHQGRLPPELMKRILFYQMQQVPSIRPDSEIQNRDLSLFGYHTIQDWFGTRFLEMVAQVVHNTALLAQEKGFKVSREEAKGDLYLNFQKGMEGLKQKKQQTISLQQQLGWIGMSESQAVEAWQKVLLFRRYFEGIGGAVLLDHLAVRELSEFAGETAIVQAYTLPEALVINTPEDLFEIQTYLDAVTVPEKQKLSMPTAYLPMDEIEKKAPEFLETLFQVQMKKVSKEEISLRATLKEVVQWQLESWNLLSKQFPFLAKVGNEREVRFAALDKLEARLRAEVDAWSRLQMVEAHPDWIEAAFEQEAPSEKTLSVGTQSINLARIEDPKRISSLFHSAAADDEKATKELMSYCDEKTTVYRFEEIQKVSERQIRTLTSMKKEGTLKKITDRTLEKHYLKIREKNPSDFQTAKGEWKPFAEVKEAVGLAYYADLYKAIDSKVSHRFAAAMKQAAKVLQETHSQPKWLDQFALVHQEKKIHRTAQDQWMNKEAFMLIPNQWSPVHVPENGRIVFFYAQERVAEPGPILSQLEAGKESISRETKQMLMKKLLQRLRKEKTVILPMQKEEEHV